MPIDPLEGAEQIKLLVLDVDGVLTDGALLFGRNGEELKRFHVRDGAGITALMAEGVEVAVISARESPAVDRRMAELDVATVLQGRQDKLAALNDLLVGSHLQLHEVACIGDDVADVPMMRSVGLAIAVADAHEAAKEASDYETAAEGGRGAVREVCDLLLETRRSKS